MAFEWKSANSTTGDPGLSPGFVAPALSALGVPHLFTTRAAIKLVDRDVVRLTQVHGCGVFEADGTLPQEAPVADAVVSTRRGRLLSIRVADCVPILLSNTDGSRVAAIHAGWRGLCAGVIPATLQKFASAELVAAIGPCISKDRFEVGPEVAQAFAVQHLQDAVHASQGRRPRIDLQLAAKLQLQRAGVHAIDTADLCTWNEEQLFYSHRRDVTAGGQAQTGRQGALIAAR